MSKKKWLVVGLVGLLLVVVGFGVYGIWRYQVWLPLVANDAGLSISNPENVPIKLASERTIDDFLDLFPEGAKKKKVVLEFHSQMPKENESYAFMKDSTWGPNGVGVACGNVENMDDEGLVTKMDVYVTTEQLLVNLGKVETTRKVNNTVRNCLIQAMVEGDLSQEVYQKLLININDSWGDKPVMEIVE